MSLGLQMMLLFWITGSWSQAQLRNLHTYHFECSPKSNLMTRWWSGSFYAAGLVLAILKVVVFDENSQSSSCTLNPTISSSIYKASPELPSRLSFFAIRLLVFCCYCYYYCMKLRDDHLKDYIKDGWALFIVKYTYQSLCWNAAALSCNLFLLELARLHLN